MKCKILVNNKMGAIPIVECGGITLAEEARIIVKEEIADRMVLQYKPRLIDIGEIEKETLRGGHYEVETDSKLIEKPMVEIKKPVIQEKIEEVKDFPLKEISLDKNMEGKGKVRKKHIGSR